MFAKNILNFEVQQAGRNNQHKLIEIDLARSQGFTKY